MSFLFRLAHFRRIRKGFLTGKVSGLEIKSLKIENRSAKEYVGTYIPILDKQHLFLMQKT